MDHLALVMAELGAAVLRGFIGMLLVTAAYGKFRDPHAFTGVVASYRILPDVLVTVFARALPVVEFTLGALLLGQIAVAFASFSVAALLALLAAAMGLNLIRGRVELRCGCGGSDRPIGWSMVGRNLLLAGLLALGSDASPGGSVLGLSATAAGMTVFLLFSVIDTILPLARAGSHLRAARRP